MGKKKRKIRYNPNSRRGTILEAAAGLLMGERLGGNGKGRDELFRQVDLLLRRLEERDDRYMRVHQGEFLKRMSRKLECGEAIDETDRRTLLFLFERAVNEEEPITIGGIR